MAILAARERAGRLRQLLSDSKTQRPERLFTLMRSVVGSSRAAVSTLSLSALVVGISESAVLVLVAHIGVAMSEARQEADFVVGPLSVEAWPVSALLALAFALALVRFAAQTTTVWTTAGLVSKVSQRLRRETLSDYLATSWDVQDQERSGHLQDVMTSFVANISLALIAFATALSAGTTFVVMIVVALIVNPLAALAVAATVGVLFTGLKPVSRAARLYARRRAEAELAFANAVNEVARSTQELRVFGVQAAGHRLVTTRSQAFELMFHRARVLAGMIPTTYQGAAMLVVVGGLGALYWSGTTAIASLSALVLIFVRAATYGQSLQSQLQQINTNAPYIEILNDLRLRYKGSRLVDGARTLGKVESLSLVGVGYRYPRSEAKTLTNLNLSIEAGEVIGVIGPSGAGKSTLAQLLMGLRSPTSGKYYVNGGDAESFALDSWSRKFTLVPQFPTLLAASVAENIAFFRDDVGPEAIERAARGASIHDEILLMPQGYNTWVGDDGKNLSGGQRQRLALARALATCPDVIVLDEPTSALDSRSEAAVQATLEGLRGRVTLIIVAHRMSTVANCDRIVVLQAGEIEAFDRPADLIRTNDYYRQALRASEGRQRTDDVSETDVGGTR